jgi:hypothetical protein
MRRRRVALGYVETHSEVKTLKYLGNLGSSETGRVSIFVYRGTTMRPHHTMLLFCCPEDQQSTMLLGSHQALMHSSALSNRGLGAQDYMEKGGLLIASVIALGSWSPQGYLKSKK